MARSRQSMNQSGNPITALVKWSGFQSKTALVIEWIIFGTLFFIVGGILIGGT